MTSHSNKSVKRNRLYKEYINKNGSYQHSDNAYKTIPKFDATNYRRLYKPIVKTSNNKYTRKHRFLSVFFCAVVLKCVFSLFGDYCVFVCVVVNFGFFCFFLRKINQFINEMMVKNGGGQNGVVE